MEQRVTSDGEIRVTSDGEDRVVDDATALVVNLRFYAGDPAADRASDKRG